MTVMSWYTTCAFLDTMASTRMKLGLGVGRTEVCNCSVSPACSQSLLLSPGSLSLGWGSVVAVVAAGIGLELSSIEERFEVIRADEDIEISSGTVAAGTISGMRFEIIGMVDGEERVIVEHVTRLRDGDAPEWPQGEGYRILVQGEPNLKMELSLSSDKGDHNHAGCLATAMHVVNAIPAVCAAEPGVLTYLNVPFYSAAC